MKAVIYFFTAIYFTLSIGFSVNIHYCKGNFKSVSFFKYTPNYTCCKKKMKKGCCGNYSFAVTKSCKDKIDDTDDYIFASEKFIALPFNSSQFLVKAIYVSKNYSKYYLAKPPPSSFPAIYIKNCVYRI